MMINEAEKAKILDDVFIQVSRELFHAQIMAADAVCYGGPTSVDMARDAERRLRGIYDIFPEEYKKERIAKERAEKAAELRRQAEALEELP